MNRYKIVSRHNPIITKADKYSPLTVGNGEFAFTADVTGLQTFPELYDKGIPLCTQSQWGWHTRPGENETGRYDLSDLEYENFNIEGRKVPYPTSSKGQGEIYNWLRQNPHRMNLAKIGLIREGNKQIKQEDITDIRQELDLWEGILSSEFVINSNKVSTEVFCHPEADTLSVKIEAPIDIEEKLGVFFEFPYGSPNKNASDWKNEEKHTTEILIQTERCILIERKLDDDVYYADIRFDDDAICEEISQHSIAFYPKEGESLSFQVWFGKEKQNAIPDFAETKNACIAYWENYWQKGGMIDFSKCTDERAFELERRVILSQYLLAVQCTGSLPPQETGLTFNSWYGKFHLEMHWWHGVHFAYWNKPELFENSMWWYGAVLNKAQQTAKMQGYDGARWQKMTDFLGNESPSPIGPLLIWQQPHPIYYAELIYSVKKNEEILEKYKDVVFETAKFMSSYTSYDKENDRYVLGPGVIPAQENHKPMETINPTFELEYWHFGLKTANKWRERLGLGRNKKWDEICDKLSGLPQKDGVYLAHENCPATYEKFNTDHPSMVGAMGILPGAKVDMKIMKNTISTVFEKWDFDAVWGWDFPMLAMTYARLNMPEKAIDALLYDAPKNEYLISGHNKQGDKEDLPIYLPGNGGLLTAVAMMAAGWEGCAKRNPGFPDGGNWDILWEGMNPML